MTRKYGANMKNRTDNISGTNAYFSVSPKHKYIIMQILLNRRAKGEKVFQTDIMSELVEIGINQYLKDDPDIQRIVEATFITKEEEDV